jgi:hypothetical protein
VLRTIVGDLGDRLMDDSTVEIAVASVGVAGTLAAALPTQVLAVMPSQVVDSTDGGLPPESGVAAVMIVEMQE